MNNTARPIEDIIRDLKLFLASYPGTQDKLANLAGVHQSTISRALSAKGRKRLSKSLGMLCNYANIKTEIGISVTDPRENQDLIASLAEVWNGTPEHAKALAKVIRSLKNLSF